MCIRDRVLADSNSSSQAAAGYWIMPSDDPEFSVQEGPGGTCLLYTSDAADERSSVDLGGRRIIKKKTSRGAR